jgi:hypothetical protein
LSRRHTGRQTYVLLLPAHLALEACTEARAVCAATLPSMLHAPRCGVLQVELARALRGCWLISCCGQLSSPLQEGVGVCAHAPGPLHRGAAGLHTTCQECATLQPDTNLCTGGRGPGGVGPPCHPPHFCTASGHAGAQASACSAAFYIANAPEPAPRGIVGLRTTCRGRQPAWLAVGSAASRALPHVSDQGVTARTARTERFGCASASNLFVAVPQQLPCECRITV